MPSKDTLVIWVKQKLKDAGLNLNIFSPQSKGSASNSKAKTYVSLKNILETGRWRSNRTFARFYDKPILQEKQYCFGILNSKNDDLCQTLRKSILGLKGLYIIGTLLEHRT